jgi:hypothetical protein
LISKNKIYEFTAGDIAPNFKAQTTAGEIDFFMNI